MNTFWFLLTPLGRRRVGWLALGRDETVALSTKSTRNISKYKKMREGQAILLV